MMSWVGKELYWTRAIWGDYWEFRSFLRLQSQGSGIEAVLSKIIEVFEDKSEVSRHIHINYGVEIETAIDKIKETIVPNRNITDRFAPRYLAIKMIEDDSITKEMLKKVPNYARIEEDLPGNYIGILRKGI